ncbi:hypothetical protein [Nocardioides sp.]|uniref:hypothetical protein n=1 Tax=Nocardioides sp. TaxID=35761 RepID=UPI00261E9BBD|nr:hypothetical protein [Nocardioides sp.]
MSVETTPLRGNEAGEGWHLRPRRRQLFAAMTVLGGVGLLVLAGLAVTQDVWWWAVPAGMAGVALSLAPFERPTPEPPRMFETPGVHGLLLPTHPTKATYTILFGIAALMLVVTPAWAVATGRGEPLDGVGDWAGALVGVVVLGSLTVLLVLATVAGVRSRRAPHRGVLLTVDAVVLRTQLRPVTIPWEAVRGFRPHWRRLRGYRDHFNSWEDPIRNWLSVEAEAERVAGDTPIRAFARVDEPTFDAASLALEPRLALEVCRFYLTDAGAREELGTDAALARVASIERSLPAVG